MAGSYISEALFSIGIAIGAFLVILIFSTLCILFFRKKLIRTTPCTLRINEHEELTKVVPSGQTLLTALTQEGIAIPSPCGGKAACKQCRIQIVQGGSPPLETDLASFSKKELAAGWRLSCQVKVQQDLHLHIEERYLEVKEWTATVISNANVATYIKELVVELPEGEEIPYKAGGYLQFHVPPFLTNTADWVAAMPPPYRRGWEKMKLSGHTINYQHLHPGSVIRAYSMASYPAEGRILKFNIRIASPPFHQGALLTNIPWGICSSYVFSLQPGDSVRLSGPYGESFMIEDSRPVIFLIGGAGSSFGRSHILHLFHTEQTKRQVDLWYGARSLQENIYQEEYEALARTYPNFRYHLVLSEPQPEDQWPTNDPVKTNFLFKAFELGQLSTLEEPEECFYYVCGPPLHNRSVLHVLDQYGVPREHIVLDDFGS